LAQQGASLIGRLSYGSPTMTGLLDELRWRGFIHQLTDEQQIERHLQEGNRRVYAGFDPTGDSLTVGNLVPIMMLAHFQRAGHTPVVLMGGGTGLIGDPSGKSAERQLLSHEQVQANVHSIQRIFANVLSFEGPNAAALVDNHDWLSTLSTLTMLRDIGKHFTVNMMIQKESVRERLHNREQGISYTEFSYMILQAYDYQHLAEQMNVTVQLGGSDQWGNIVAGIDLTRRLHRREVFGITSPLLTRADGGKFGKTEKDAVWLSGHRTSAYAFYQFWMNTTDADVPRFIRLFTFLEREAIDTVLEEHAADPAQRKAQRALAREATRIIHGHAGLQRAEAATEALFSGHVENLDLSTLNDAFAEAPSSQHDRSMLALDGLSLVELLPLTSLCKSKREAREFLGNGSISVNGKKASSETHLGLRDLLHDEVALLRRGRKAWHVTR